MRTISFKDKILSSLRRVKKTQEDISSILSITMEDFSTKLEDPYAFTKDELNILCEQLCFLNIRYLISGTKLFCDEKYIEYLSKEDIAYCKDNK